MCSKVKLICGIQVYCLIEITNLLMGASLLALAKSIYYTILDKTVEKKLHTWGAFFLNFVADRFFPSPLPLEAVVLGLQNRSI